MRIDELLNQSQSNIVSKNKYNQLLRQLDSFLVYYSSEDGWKCEKAENMDKRQALNWLTKHWQMTRYEKHHNIRPIHRTICIHVVELDEDDNEPDWPKELKPYKDAIYPEAYLCHKFGIELPSDLIDSS